MGAAEQREGKHKRTSPCCDSTDFTAQRSFCAPRRARLRPRTRPIAVRARSALPSRAKASARCHGPGRAAGESTNDAPQRSMRLPVLRAEAGRGRCTLVEGALRAAAVSMASRKRAESASRASELVASMRSRNSSAATVLSRPTVGPLWSE